MRLIVCCILFTWISFTAIHVHAAPQAEDGRFDLSSLDLESAGPISLNGKWHFYEATFLSPEQLLSASDISKYRLIQAPATWGSQSQTIGMGNHGFGTYHLTIVLSEGNVGKPLGLAIPSIASAYQLFINGTLTAAAGAIGTSAQDMLPAAQPRSIYFTSNSQEVELLVYVSNFSQRKGGIWSELKLGSAEHIAQENQHRLLFQAFIATGFLLIGIFHVVFYLLRTDKSTLYFGLSCLLLFLRTLFVGEMLALQLIPAIPWEIAVKIEYVSVFWGISLLVLYFYHLYRNNLNAAVSYSLAMLLIVLTLPVLVLPARIYTEWMVFYQILVLILIAYILYGLLRAVLYRHMGARINLAAGLIFLVTAINDILYYNFILESIDLVTLGLFIFIFTQMFMLAKKFAFSFREAEQLRDVLEKTNINLEQIVEERTAALRRSNAKLKRSEQARTDLLSDITHELSNPLTSIIGYLRRLKDGVAEDMQSRHIEVAYKKALMLNHVVGDLSQLAHLEQEHISYSFHPMTIQELYEALKKTYDWELLDRQITVTLNASGEDHALLCIDLQRMEQAFTNIVNNALIHTKQQDQIIIVVRYFSFVNACVIAVQDTGAGIDKKDQAQLFERFYRAKRNESANYSGSGLGLTIAKKIMEAHHGRIGMRSVLGKGSIFYLILPAMREGCS